MLSLDELLTHLRDIGSAQLRGMKKKGFVLAIFGVEAMRGLMASPLAKVAGRRAYRRERWKNIQAELQNVRRIARKHKLALPANIASDLDFYCRCAAPREFD